jgi:regulator of replication initiation timing
MRYYLVTHPKRQETMQEENVALESQYKSLRELVGELLQTNQRLRMELNRLQQGKAGTQATHADH